MIRFWKRHRAIGSYFWRLSQELTRRFGRKNYYGIEEVCRAAQEKKFDMAFIAYAHAMFCSRGDFDSHYGPMQLACTYAGLREVVAYRFLPAIRMSRSLLKN
jgi:hypothetical protein